MISGLCELILQRRAQARAYFKRDLHAPNRKDFPGIGQ
jgi:hypothetical protein